MEQESLLGPGLPSAREAKSRMCIISWVFPVKSTRSKPRKGHCFTWGTENQKLCIYSKSTL